MADDENNTNDTNDTTTEAAEAGNLGRAADPFRRSQAEKIEASIQSQEEAAEAKREKANINAASANNIEASGAIMEPGMKKAVDVDHPAVDNNPRAGTTVQQNQIDFNDPTIRANEAVKENLNNG